MLQHVPHAIGNILKSVRPGLEKTVYHYEDFADIPETITVMGKSFANGTPIPARYTEDGKKISPPLEWDNLPTKARGVVLLIEDADSPTPQPLVHAIVLDLRMESGELPEAALKSAGNEGHGYLMGKNSFGSQEYLPPDPPPGHGVHQYAFQLFALDQPITLDAKASRSDVVKSMRGHVIAKGLLIGTYERK